MLLMLGNRMVDRNSTDIDRKRAIVEKMVHSKRAKKFYYKMREITNIVYWFYAEYLFTNSADPGNILFSSIHSIRFRYS